MSAGADLTGVAGSAISQLAPRANRVEGVPDLTVEGPCTQQPEPYVRIWCEHPSSKEVAMLLADDYRRVMRQRDELLAANKFLRTILEGIATADLRGDGGADLCYCRWFVGVAKQALEHTPAAGPAGQ